MKLRPSAPLLRLALLTAVAIAVHGYHFGTDDGAVYLPAVVHSIHPQLYPYGAEFFKSHADLSIFTAVVGASAPIFHRNVEWTVFLWHVLSIFIYLIAIWRLASICFESSRGRWSATILSVVVLTVPAAGTALVLVDPYLTARSASTPLSMLTVGAFLACNRREAIFWLALTALVHPQMAVFTAGYLIILALPAKWTTPLFELKPWANATAAALPLGFSFSPTTPEYHQAIEMRDFLSVLHWRWFEWLGIAIPLAMLFAFSQIRLRNTTETARRLSRSLVIFGVAATALGLIFASSPRLETFLRLQPMRAFQLIYIVFFLLLGALLGEYALKSRYWLWASLFTAIGAGMFLIQQQNYPNSNHIEWPGATSTNPWVAAFQWVRDNTPKNAVFALDPYYIEIPGEDEHGFRGIAQRSVLTDHFKDSGVVSLFPQLAPEWAREQQAQQNWPHFQLTDFQRLVKQYPVSWIVLQGTPPNGLACPFHNEAVAVCKIPGAPGLSNLY